MKKMLMFAAVATSLLASCSNEEITTQKSADKELSFKVAGIVSTKGIIDGGAFTDVNTRIGIFAANNVALETDYALNPLAVFGPALANPTTIDATKPWVCDGANIALSTQEAKLYAYYPYDAAKVADVDKATGLMKVTIDPTSDFKATDKKDYMFATNDNVVPVVAGKLAVVKNSSYTANLFFHHALAKVTFKVIKGATYGSGAGQLTSITLAAPTAVFKQTKVDNSSTLNLETGAFADVDAVTSFALTNAAVTIKDAVAAGMVNDGTADFLIQGLAIPTELLPIATTGLDETNSIKITMNVDGVDISGYLPFVAGVESWLANKNYVYTITVTGKGLEVSKDVQIVSWGADIPASFADVN